MSDVIKPTEFKFQLDEAASSFRLEQDIRPYLQLAAEKRLIDSHSKTTRNWRSFAIIPDIVAIDIKLKYGIDIHDPVTTSDQALMTKFRGIVQSEYPALLTQDRKTRAH